MQNTSYPQPEQLAHVHGLVRQRAERRMAVHDFDLFPDQDVPQQWNVTDHGRQNDLVVEHLDGNVVNLEAVGHVADALPVAVRVRHDDHFVAPGQQTLRQVEDVLLHSAHVRVEEIRGDADMTETNRDQIYINSLDII